MLWEKQIIAIHFPRDKSGELLDSDNESTEPADYSLKQRHAVQTLVTLGREGGYVCTEYRGLTACLIGKVLPGTALEIVTGRWGAGEHAGRIAMLKSLRLTQVKEIPASDQPATIVGRPRQGTLLRWPSAKNAISDLVEGRDANLDLDSLYPWEQEIMCSEFLRGSHPPLPLLAHLLLPIGRTMKDIDILALAADGKRIYCQVTHLSLNAAQPKLRRLADNVADANHAVLFCDCDQIDSLTDVVIYPIALAFEQFRATPSGAAWMHGLRLR